MRLLLIIFLVMICQNALAGIHQWICPDNSAITTEFTKTRIVQWCERSGQKYGPSSVHDHSGTILEMTYFEPDGGKASTDVSCPPGARAQLEFKRDIVQECFLPKNGGFIREGRSLAWHSSGRLTHSVPYHNDKKHGLEQMWYSSGQKQLELSFVSGVP